MTQYDNTNSGLLKRNDRKEKDTHPDYRGTINVNGQDFWLSAWLKEGRPGSKLEGQKYFSLSVSPMEDQQQRRTSAPRQQQGGYRASEPRRATAPATSQGGGFDDMDDDIPF